MSGVAQKKPLNMCVFVTYRMIGRDFSSISIHTPSCLPRLDVSPDHGPHVAFVVHETSVEVRGLVRVGRNDVSEASRERVFEEVEHGEEFAGWQMHVVTEPTSTLLAKGPKTPQAL